MIEITKTLVCNLIKEQFPQWANLEIEPVEHNGHDNRTFRLGDEMTVRLPSGKEYVPQVEKEMKWLPFLSKHLSLPISCPIAHGKPAGSYPFPWLINKYIPGKMLSKSNVPSLNHFASLLSDFLKGLQKIDTKGAPVAGQHNFFRGAHPSVYNEQVTVALQELSHVLPTDKIREIWENAIFTKWKKSPVLVHGDIAPGNLLVKDGTLCGVIDFGIMGIGDPACDYAIAWTFFDSQSRKYFLQGLDKGTIDRARGWALWKALVTYGSSEQSVEQNAKHTINEIMSEIVCNQERKNDD
ncbi:MAG: aminoglycoside phosphotransferase family protein [Clostridiales bacterium]|uniref:aminoglycoside phosphotransferase family protein n=1 Tax=Flavonifractor porci TaxID=3133422 RepID=UPI00309A88E5|nr:aminoglycoside phosphotransferase family protein [Clostridiales bacterium]